MSPNPDSTLTVADMFESFRMLFQLQQHKAFPIDDIDHLNLENRRVEHVGELLISQLRKGLQFATALQSDSAPLNALVARMAGAAGGGLRVLRDPTRGGLAATLNEIAAQSSVGVRLHESALPVRSEVRGACELLGLDPLNVANEGKLIAIVAADQAQQILAAMQRDPNGAEAAIIGEVIEDPLHLVRMVTAIGGERVIDWLHGEQLPRIC